MKKIFFRSVATIMILLISLLGLTACSDKISVTYQASEGGSITGQTNQKIDKGGDGMEVTAVPLDGYFFVRWDDGFRYPNRQEKDVQTKTTVKAIFAPKTRIYKILMVYVTEIKATLTTADGDDIIVDYKLTETELKICELISVQMSAYLNDMMNGHVYFEVDSYFTTVPIGKDSINRTRELNYEGIECFDYKISATDIPELTHGVTDIGQMFTEYNSVITTFSMNDWEGLLHNSSGSAGRKYASIHLEARLGQFVADGVPFESLFDLAFKSNSYSSWDTMMYTQIHEFIHTIEIILAYDAPFDYMDFHNVISEYYTKGIYDILYISKMYLTNQAVLNGKTGGIPEWYWEQFRI